jgi:formate/nitrite transporter
VPQVASRQGRVLLSVRARAISSPSDLPAAPTSIVLPTEAAPPPAVYQRVVEAGVAKAKLPLWKLILLGFVAGFYIGFGALLMLNIGVSCPGLASTNPGLQKLVMGAVGLPFGLIMVMICGAELFTGNTMIMGCAFYEGRITLPQLLRSWVVSFGMNLAGSIALVTMVYYAGIAPPLATAAGVAGRKAGLNFTQAFLRGILANWLVNIAIWQATASSSISGKIMAAIIPITTFVGLGLEHSVANMFFIPMAMKLGADISVRDFLLGNLLPVTLGNIIGGAVCVAGVYALAFGRPGNSNAAPAMAVN